MIVFVVVVVVVVVAYNSGALVIVGSSYSLSSSPYSCLSSTHSGELQIHLEVQQTSLSISFFSSLFSFLLYSIQFRSCFFVQIALLLFFFHHLLSSYCHYPCCLLSHYRELLLLLYVLSLEWFSSSLSNCRACSCSCSCCCHRAPSLFREPLEHNSNNNNNIQ